MSILVKCDFCGVTMEEYSIQEDYRLMDYKSAGHICCDACETRWEEYEKELQKAEDKARRSLDDEKERIKKHFFNKQERIHKDIEMADSAGTSDREVIRPKTFKTRLR